MSTLILKAPGVLTAPLPGTPTIPDLVRGLLFNFDADKLMLNDADPVASWPNSDGSMASAANLVFASTDRPKLVKNGVSTGHQSVRLTTSPATFLRTNQNAPFNPAPATPISVSVLLKFAKAADGSTVQNIFSGRVVEKYLSARRNASGRISMGANGADQIVSQGMAPVGIWFPVTFIFNGAKSRMFFGSEKLSGTTTQTDWDGIVLGANALQANNMDGEIAAFCAYNRALSDPEVTLLHQQGLSSRGL
jgi:hypothetical protein